MQERVTDADDPRLADYTRLTDVKLRTSLEAEAGLFIAEGTKVISRAVAAVTRCAPCWSPSAGWVTFRCSP